MASPEAEALKAKQDELHAAIADMDAKEAEYLAARSPYLATKTAYIDAISAVDAIDNELEAMQQAYEPPAPPQNE